MANETQSTQIRQADNSVEVEGILKEVNLEQRTTANGNIISGRVTILAGPNTEISVEAFASEYTRENKPNSAYRGLRTVMEEYQSIAALLKAGATNTDAQAQATRVRLGSRASLARREYYASNGELVSNIQVSSNYFNRVEPELCTPHATFDVEVYFDKIRPEFKGDEETGRLLVDAILPVYNGQVVPVQLVAEGETADYIRDNFPPKSTAEVWGDISFTVQRTETRKSGFGAVKTKVETTYKRELVITGGKGEPYDPEDPRAFKPEAIQAAWQIRETETLPALLQKSKEKAKSSPPKAPGFTADSRSDSTPPFNAAAPAAPQFKW